MKTICQEVVTSQTPESLAEEVRELTGMVLLRSALFQLPSPRYSLLAVNPFLVFRSWGSRCEMASAAGSVTQYGNPWELLSSLLARYELLEEIDLPFPLGGAFGYWGYDLKNHLEPRLGRRAVVDVEVPECQVGFYDSLVVFDHRLGKTWIISTGYCADGTRQEPRACAALEFWRHRLEAPVRARESEFELPVLRSAGPVRTTSSLDRLGYVSGVRRALEKIRAGEIYQVNLAQRLRFEADVNAWVLFLRLIEVSPALYMAFMDAGEFQIVSASPEQFLKLSGSHMQTRPIKGTRPRGADATLDAQLTYELQTSPKEMAELVMITDLLRNDLGRCCEYGSVQVPELVRLERFPQVQHLVSTIEGRLCPGLSHMDAVSRCFPGGSITGAPKIRAMDIIDELEPVARGPYTGCLGYLGFNRESQLNILIRTAICRRDATDLHVGAGIVAESQPEREYDETLAKAAGFVSAFGVEIKLEQQRACRNGS